MGRNIRDTVGIIVILSMLACCPDHEIPETPVYDGEGPVVTATPIPVPTIAITGYPIPY